MSPSPACARICAPTSGWRRISLPLVVVERARLVQRRVADGELAQVVQDAGGAQALDPVRPQPEGGGGGRGERADRPRVVGRAGVAQVEGLGEDHHGGEALRGADPADGGQRGLLLLDLLDHQRGVVGHRHQDGQLVVVRAPAGERVVDRHHAEQRPVRAAQRQQQRVVRIPGVGACRAGSPASTSAGRRPTRASRRAASRRRSARAAGRASPPTTPTGCACPAAGRAPSRRRGRPRPRARCSPSSARLTTTVEKRSSARIVWASVSSTGRRLRARRRRGTRR